MERATRFGICDAVKEKMTIFFRIAKDTIMAINSLGANTKRERIVIVFAQKKSLNSAMQMVMAI